jgi:hypothetical protein
MFDNAVATLVNGVDTELASAVLGHAPVLTRGSRVTALGESRSEATTPYEQENCARPRQESNLRPSA